MAVLNGINHSALPALAAQCGEIVVQQGQRDACLTLQRAGHAISRHIRKGPFDMVLVLAGRQREQTLAWLAQGAKLLSGDGLLLIAAANDMGAKGYEKRLGDLGAEIQVSSKAKCRIAALQADRISRPEVLNQWLAAAAPRRLADSGLISCPGVFCWDRTDVGSRLLLEHLPEGLSGRGMDIGCGNGYLSQHVLTHYAAIREWHAVDVDAVALACAEQNLHMQGSACRVCTHWLDATTETLPGDMDVIVMNPPFHRDKADLPSLGQDMIRSAQRSLKASGSLFLVANRHLPYEALLYDIFDLVYPLYEGEGYKVVRCDTPI